VAGHCWAAGACKRVAGCCKSLLNGAATNSDSVVGQAAAVGAGTSGGEPTGAGCEWVLEYHGRCCGNCEVCAMAADTVVEQVRAVDGQGGGECV
jgi:hypothetical protein